MISGPTAPTPGSCAAPNASLPCSTTMRSPPAPMTSWGTGTPSSSPLCVPCPHLPAGRPLVRIVPRPHLPEPPVPGRRDGPRSGHRRTGEMLRPTDQRHDLRSAHPPWDRLGELSQHLAGTPRRLSPHRPRRPSGHRQARPHCPTASRHSAPRVGVQAAVHGRRLRRQRAGARPPRPRHEAVLPRRGDRPAARLQHRRSQLRRLLGRTAAGHPSRRAVRRDGDRRRHARARTGRRRWWCGATTSTVGTTTTFRRLRRSNPTTCAPAPTIPTPATTAMASECRSSSLLPYARPGAVLHEVFDHTSILRLVEDVWNLPSLTRRDAAATSPIGALDLDSPPAFLHPPLLSPPALGLAPPPYRFAELPRR